MSDNRSERSGRRSRGGRRRSKDRGDRNDRNDRAETTSAPQQKVTLWQKIVSFFRPKTSKAKTGDARPARQYPAYEPRQKSTERNDRFESGERPARPQSSEPREAREPRPSRKPENVEVTTPKLYIGNLSFDATESDLSNLFNGVGQVQSTEIVTHKETEKSKGFGFVTMTNIDEAKRAVVELHDKDFMGRKLVVSGAKTPGR